MVRYELFNQLKTNKLFVPLVSGGIISVNIAAWLDIYETFKQELRLNEKVLAIQFTADYYNMTSGNIYKIIKFMET